METNEPTPADTTPARVADPLITARGQLSAWIMFGATSEEVAAVACVAPAMGALTRETFMARAEATAPAEEPDGAVWLYLDRDGAVWGVGDTKRDAYLDAARTWLRSRENIGKPFDELGMRALRLSGDRADVLELLSTMDLDAAALPALAERWGLAAPRVVTLDDLASGAA